MAAKRYSGRATVTVRLTPRDEYIANVSVGGRNVYTLVTLPPPGSRIAIDSPAAYDDVARAALSFWSDEGGPAEGTFEWGDGGPEVSRTKPRASKANGRRRVGAKRATKRNAWRPVPRPFTLLTARDWQHIRSEARAMWGDYEADGGEGETPEESVMTSAGYVSVGASPIGYVIMRGRELPQNEWPRATRKTRKVKSNSKRKATPRKRARKAPARKRRATSRRRRR
jgi:hypothetical protein